MAVSKPTTLTNGEIFSKIRKVEDRLKSGEISCKFLTSKECQEFADRFFAVDFTNEKASMSNFKVDSEEIGMGNFHVKVYSLLDIDTRITEQSPSL